MGSAPDGPHPAAWWGELIATSPRFDEAYFVEELAGILVPRIANPLIRRELELAVATANRHLLRPANAEFADDATAGRQRLQATLARLDTGTTDVTDAAVLAEAISGDYAAAAAGAERLAGSVTLLHLVVAALRLERFDTAMAVRMLSAGRPAAEAVQTGMLMGRYQWWPRWLLDLATERALAGALDENLIAALDRCAYAPLTPAQVHVARKLLNRDAAALAAAASHLDRLGEQAAATDLRDGDLTVVALAAKLMSM